jgi:hypothetical protein
MSQNEFLNSPIRSAALPWLTPFVVDSASNMTREINMAGGDGLYVNALAFEGFRGEGGEGGDELLRCEINAKIKIEMGSSSNNSSSSNSSSGSGNTPRLVVLSSASASATMCIQINNSCDSPRSCTISVAAAVAPPSSAQNSCKLHCVVS